MRHVIRVVGTNHLWPAIVGSPPYVAKTKEAAKRKLRYEIPADHRSKYEVVPYDPVRMVQVNARQSPATG